MAALLATLAAPVLPAAQPAIFPVEEVRPGMVGEGRTVFQGDRIETFGVEIIGVVEGAFPGRRIVLANLSGGPLAHTGVIQGMSGSPVYLEGRLLGAVAYAFPFSRDAICGITPFGEMIRFTEAGAAPGALRFSEAGIPSLEPRPALGVETANGQLAPIRTPVAASGMSAAGRALAAPLFRELGMELAPGGFANVSRAGGQASGSAPLAPGSPVGATLIGGDLVLMAGGTVTHVEEATGEVFAFGHPFLGLGPVSLPMQEARAEVSVASLMNSFRLSSAGAAIGVWRQDRATGIRGRLGARARTIPMNIRMDTSRGGRRDYALELVEHDLLTPTLSFTGLVAVLGQEERPAGPQTIRVEARFDLAEGRALRVEDIFSTGGPGVPAGAIGPAAALVAAPVALLLGNPVARIPVRNIEVEVSATEEARTATLSRAWLMSSRVRPGEAAVLRIAVRDYRGAERVRELEIPVPASAAGELLQLRIEDALAATVADRAQGVSGTPTRVEQVFRAIARRRRQSALHVRLVGAGRSAAVVGSEYLPSLPPSVRSVVSRDASGGFTRTLSTSVLWEGRLDFDASVRGSRRLALEVEPR